MQVHWIWSWTNLWKHYWCSACSKIFCDYLVENHFDQIPHSLLCKSESPRMWTSPSSTFVEFRPASPLTSLNQNYRNISKEIYMPSCYVCLTIFRHFNRILGLLTWFLCPVALPKPWGIFCKFSILVAYITLFRCVDTSNKVWRVEIHSQEVKSSCNDKSKYWQKS